MRKIKHTPAGRISEAGRRSPAVKVVRNNVERFLPDIAQTSAV
jgi:hypothetical protein